MREWIHICIEVITNQQAGGMSRFVKVQNSVTEDLSLHEEFPDALKPLKNQPFWTLKLHVSVKNLHGYPQGSVKLLKG